MSSKSKKISFPRDNQAHHSIIEWWYFNGHLWDKTGKHYSFMDCLFKVDPKRAKIPLVSKILLRERLIVIPYVYFAHSVVTDITKQKNYKKIQYVSLVSRDSFSQPLLFINYVDPTAISGYTNCEIIETPASLPPDSLRDSKRTGRKAGRASQFNFQLKSENLDLQLKSKKKPLLEGGHGYVKLCNRQYYYYSLTDLRAKELGFIFQGYNLLPSLTAMENVMLAGDYAGLPAKQTRERAETLLKDVGLTERFDHTPAELSGGEQQRVTIARSLMNDGRLILADEPTGELDTKNSEAIVELLRDLVKRKQKTIVMVTHNENLTHFCDRVIKIVDGILA